MSCIAYMPNGHNLESFLCSLAQEEEFSEQSCSDGELLDTLNMSHTVNRSYSEESQTDCLTTHQSLETSDCSLRRDTRKPTQVTLTLSAQASRSCASHFQPLGGDVVKPTSEICGVQQSNVSASYDRDMRYWKMCQGYLLADTSERFSETWSKAGMIVAGEYFPQQKWERPISEIDYGSLLPTPAAQEPGIHAERLVDKHGNEPAYWNQRLYDRHTGRYAQRGLTQYAQMFPTPRVQDSKHGAATDWELNSGRNELHIAVTKAQYQSQSSQFVKDLICGSDKCCW